MEQVQNTFWGVVLQPGKRYEHTVEKSFHISMAVLDTSNSSAGGRSQVMITVDGNEFILCHLSEKIPQQALDLNFQLGDSLVLHINGKAPQPVHLTGFYNDIVDDDDMDDFQMADSDEEEEDVPQLLPAELKSLKRKKDSPVKEAAKKAKIVPAVKNDKDSDSDYEDEDDDDSDEEEGEDEKEEEEEEGFSDDEEDDDNEEDDDDEDDEDDDEDDEEDDDEDDDEEEEETKPEIPLKKTKQTPKKQPELNGVGAGDSAKKKVKEPKTTPAKPDVKQPPTPKSAKKTISGGVMIEDLTVGAGAVAKRGRPVSVYYVGRLKQNNKQFDATVGGPGFKFKLGGKEVIKGWDVGVEGMKVGGKRRITCPPHMAYGPRGSPPVIPPNSALVFDVTLKAVH